MTVSTQKRQPSVETVFEHFLLILLVLLFGFFLLLIDTPIFCMKGINDILVVKEYPIDNDINHSPCFSLPLLNRHCGIEHLQVAVPDLSILVFGNHIIIKVNNLQISIPTETTLIFFIDF